MRLSLSSRPIREVLLDPTSTVIWASARRAAGLPDLTSPNMNEIQYAQLVFLDSCQVRITLELPRGARADPLRHAGMRSRSSSPGRLLPSQEDVQAVPQDQVRLTTFVLIDSG